MKLTLISIILGIYSLALILGTYGYMIRNEANEIFDHFEDQQEKVTEIKEKIVYRDKVITKKIEVIKHVQAPCLDDPLPADIDDELYQIYSLAKQP